MSSARQDPTVTAPVLLPNEVERCKIFHLLKQASSVTAWRRILHYYQQWAGVTAQCVRVADERGWQDDTSVPRSDLEQILECVAHCQAGVDRLARGDKRVFQFDRRGEFAMATGILWDWCRKLDRIRIGETGVREHTPLWPRFYEALRALDHAWHECGQFILEPRQLEQRAPLYHHDWLEKYLEARFYPDVLPAVPDPADVTLVRTGRTIPCSGIWEPVDAPAPSLLRWVLRSPRPVPPFTPVGTMNYLHGGSAAPRAYVTTASGSRAIAVTWRLLWQDERYQDGTIPEEEAGYRFVHPAPLVPPLPLDPHYEGPIWAASGVAAPVAGRWLLGYDMRTAVMAPVGMVLPQYERDDVRWVLLPSARCSAASAVPICREPMKP